MELMILESSLPISWQGKAYFIGCYDVKVACPVLQYSKGRLLYIVKTRCPEPQNMAQTTFRSTKIRFQNPLGGNLRRFKILELFLIDDADVH